MPIEHLLVIAPEPAPVQPDRDGWLPYGAVSVDGVAHVDRVWVYGRATDQPAPLQTEDEKRRARDLFSGEWSPDSLDTLTDDLRLCFAPCQIEAAPCP